MDKEGALGYAIYFMICELCAEKIDETLNPEIKISWPYVEKLTHCRRATVRRVLAGCSVAVRRESGGSPAAALLVDNSTSTDMICTVPNLLKRLDNWTKRSVVTTQELPIEENKNKKEKRREREYTTDFLSFWNSYPRKAAKRKAFQIFERLNPSPFILREILKAVEAHKNSGQWNEGNGKFIPYPATWLNQERWLDELVEDKEKQQRKVERAREWRPPKEEDCAPPSKAFLKLKEEL